jgi:subtilisin family serine protease
VTLVTGQTVEVVERGGRRAYLTDATEPMRRVTVGNRTYVYPEGVSFETFEPALFDVDRLLAEGVGDGESTTVPVIVTLAGGAGAGADAAAGDDAGGVSALSGVGTRRLESIDARAAVVPKSEAAAVARALRRDPSVERVYLDRMVDVALAGSANATAAGRARRAANVSGAGVRVAVLDTGIDDSHPAVDEGTVVAGRDFTGGSSTADYTGHGTHVAGIVAGDGDGSDGRYRGVAPNASLLDARVVGPSGGRTSWIVDGLEWAVEEGADVASLSLGGGVDGNEPLVAAVERASANGTVVVVAAGNDGEAGSVGSPGVAPSAVTVGAYDDATAELAAFSSRGPAEGPTPLKPDLLAPGVDVVSACGGGAACGGDPYTSRSGTSMATPHVSGVAALALEAHPTWTPGRVKDVLATTADPLPATPPLGVYAEGAGRVNATRALSTPVVVENASRYLGTVRDDGAVDGAVRVRNLGRRDRVVTVSATLRNLATGESLAPTFERSRVVLAPNESVRLPFTLDGPVPYGRYSGRLRVTTAADGTGNGTATGDGDGTDAADGTDDGNGTGSDDETGPGDATDDVGNGTPSDAGNGADADARRTYTGVLGLARPYALRVEKRALAGTSVEGDLVHAMPYAAFSPGSTGTAASLPGETLAVTDGDATVDSFGGRYLVWSVGTDERTGERVLTYGTARVDGGDATVVLDETETVRYDLDASAFRERYGPLANLTVQPTFQRYVDAEGCRQSRPDCFVEVELVPEANSFRPSRGVRFTPSAATDASVEYLLVPQSSRPANATATTLDSPVVVHLLAATAGVEGSRTFDADPARLARLNRTYRRASPGAAYGVETLVLTDVWRDNGDVGRAWTVAERTNQSYYLTPETATYLLAERYDGDGSGGDADAPGGADGDGFEWTTDGTLVPRRGERRERAVNVHPLLPAVADWDLDDGGFEVEGETLVDGPTPRLSFADVADVAVTVERDGAVVATDDELEYEADGPVAPGTTYRVSVAADQSAMPLSTRVDATYRGRYEAGTDAAPPALDALLVPADGDSRVPSEPFTVTVEASDAPGSATSARLLYAPASVSASPLDAEDGRLVVRDGWREAAVARVGDGRFEARVDPPASPRLHLAVAVRDDAGNVALVRVENATRVDLPAPVVAGGRPATSVDADPALEDVDGDGRAGVGDVVVLFSHLDDPVVRSNVAAFDFNGDGRVGVGDVVALFVELFR